MLVAGAALSFLAPIGAQASDINLDDMNSYSGSVKSTGISNFSTIQPGDWAFQSIKDLATARGCDVSIPNKAISRFEAAALLNSCLGDVAEVTATERTLIDEFSEELATIKGRVDGIEAKLNNFEAGGFSDTTTMDGKAVFTLGQVDTDTDSYTETVIGTYMYNLNLNSSFTGDDNLYVRVKTGNSTSWQTQKKYGTYLSSAKGNGDVFKVDKIWYSFPVLDRHTVWVGPKIENYYMHAASPSIYKPVTKQFTLGGNGNAYGASTDTGFGWAYNADNGFSVSSNIGTKSLTTKKGNATGLLTDESKTSWATQFGYTKPQYSVSAIVNFKYNGWTDSYYHTNKGNDKLGDGDFTAIGLRGWWRPEDSGTAVPAVSVGFDTTDYSNANKGEESAEAYFVGLTWSDLFQADDKIGVAFGQPTKNDSEVNDPFAWEAYYSFKANDSVTITPTLFGGSDRDGSTTGDVSGVLVETTFKF